MLLAVWWALLYLLLVGLAAGWVAWLALGKRKSLSRDRQQPNWALLLGIGVAGSFLGGMTVSLLSGDGLRLRPSGMLVSAVGAIVVALAYAWYDGRKG